MDAAAQRQAFARTAHVSQLPSAMSHSSNTSPVEGPPRGTLSHALYQSRSNQGSPIIGSSPFSRSGESPRSLQSSISSQGAAGGAPRDSPLTTPRSGHPGPPARTNSTPQVSTSKDSPPNSAAALAMEKRRNAAQRPDEAHMFRTSSMDSTHSSMSSATTFSQNSSTVDGGPSSAEIAMMIQTAGSAENLVRQLLKDKRSAVAQNNQLFKLLNKQKSMMQGMHTDLEKAMVDREKYKKIAEQLSHLPITPDVPWQQVRKPSPAISTSSGPSTGSGDPLPIQRFPDLEPAINGTRKLETIASPQIRSTTTTPRTLSDATVRPDDRDTKRDTAIQDRPAALQIHKANGTPEKHKSPQSPKTPKTPDVQTDSARASFTARRSMTQRKEGQQSAPGSPIEATASSPSTRKPPPAPLNLGKPPAPPAPVRAPEQHGAEDHTESDYTDTDLDDDLPTFERGRKKTREEDDEEREVIMIRAHRASQSAAKDKSRSKSSKKSSVKGQKSPPVEELPKSPSFMSFSPPESPRSFSKGQSASIAGLLSAPSSQTGASSIQERVLVQPPLKSPGLPVSPRPQDRPVNAAAPRGTTEGNTSNSGAASNAAASITNVSTPASSSLSPRPPRHPIPMPANAPTGPLPQPPMSAPLQPRSQPSHTVPVPQSAALHAPHRQAPITSSSDAANSHGPLPGTIYHGLISEAYPDLLLPPNALPSIVIKVTSSRLRPSRQSTIGMRNTNDDSVFTLGISARSSGKQLWRVEKAAVSLVQLDHALKQLQPFNIKVPNQSLFSGHAPAKIDARRVALESFFEALLDTPMNEKAATCVCKFFSTQVIPAEESLHERSQASVSSIKDGGPVENVVKEGYLTKKGKNFGGWKARYFVLYEPVLRYYESPGGGLLGAIRLTHAQIGRQSAHKRSPSRGGPSEEDADSQYRHAFLIMEPKRNNSTSQLQHVLCAESDAERDEWVEALMFHLGKEADSGENKEKSKGPTRESSARDKASLLQTMYKDREKRDRPSDASDNLLEDSLRGFSYSESTAGQAPVMVTTSIPPRNVATPPPSASISAQSMTTSSPNQRNISGPSGGAPIQDASSWGNKDPMSTSKDMISGPLKGAPITDASIWGNKDAISGPRNAKPITDATTWGNKAADRIKAEELQAPVSPRTLTTDKAEKEVRKRSFWGFRGHSTSDSTTALSSSLESESAMARRPVDHAVFGLALSAAIEYCMSPGSTLILPSVAYRCLEYLNDYGAEMEEGLFRISGSQTAIQKLKERFNTEGDVNLKAERDSGRGAFDVHAIASLLKLYLRELPERILTNSLYPHFLKAQELDSEAKRVSALNYLVHKLPLENWTLLLHLMKFLVQVDAASEHSKMTVRNIGIVFAPTLNVSNPLIAHFIKDFHAIFETSPEGEQGGKGVIEVTAPKSGTAATASSTSNGAPLNESPPSGLGLQYDDVLQATQGMQLDDTSSLASDSTRMTNTSSTRGTPTSYDTPNTAPTGVLNMPGGGAKDTRDPKQKRRESSMQMLMGGFPGPGTTTHGAAGVHRTANLPLMREE